MNMNPELTNYCKGTSNQENAAKSMICQETNHHQKFRLVLLYPILNSGRAQSVRGSL